MSQKNIILPIVGKNGTKDDYKKMVEMYESSTNAQMKEALMNGITSVKSNDLIESSLNYTFSGQIRNQDIWMYVRLMIMNRYTKEIARKYIYDNWQKFLDKYNVGSTELLIMTKVVGMHISSQTDFDFYKNFFKNPIPGTEQAINQTIERIQSRLSIIDRIIKDPFFEENEYKIIEI